MDILDVPKELDILNPEHVQVAKGDARLGISSAAKTQSRGLGQLVIAGGILGSVAIHTGTSLQEIMSVAWSVFLTGCRSVVFAMQPTRVSISELIEIAVEAHMPRK